MVIVGLQAENAICCLRAELPGFICVTSKNRCWAVSKAQARARRVRSRQGCTELAAKIHSRATRHLTAASTIADAYLTYASQWIVRSRRRYERRDITQDATLDGRALQVAHSVRARACDASLAPKRTRNQVDLSRAFGTLRSCRLSFIEAASSARPVFTTRGAVAAWHRGD